MTFDVKGKRVTVAGAARSGLAAAEPVSYTHLTLPTIYSV